MAADRLSFWQRNSLTIVVVGLMLVFVVAQALAGHRDYNHDLLEMGARRIDLWSYLGSGHFVSAIFENWESEFLQMGMFVMLTAALRQKGSAESRPMSEAEEHPRIEPGTAPWPVRAGGVWKLLYGHSLAIAFYVLFLISFMLHLAGSWRREVRERVLQGEAPVAISKFLVDSRFWFESFQNWQSEFMAVASVVLLSIWLRQKGSPQSKPLQAPHSQTGT